MEIKLSIEYYIERDQKYVSINGINWRINTLEDLGDIVKDYVEDEFEGVFEEE